MIVERSAPLIEELRSPLAEVLSDMSSEIADNDSASYRHQLHERRGRLREVQSKLTTSQA